MAANLRRVTKTLKALVLSGLFVSSRTFTFLKWCRAEGYTDLSLPNIQVKETVKGSYTDEELIALLRKPAKDCDFCEYRNWVIVNFLIYSGCRAGTIRSIQNRDVSLSDKRVIYRHTKTGKLQSVPLKGKD